MIDYCRTGSLENSFHKKYCTDCIHCRTGSLEIRKKRKEKKRKEKKSMNKNTTKICPECGNTRLAKFHSFHKKYCPDCYTWIEWDLEPGQKPLLQKRGEIDGETKSQAAKSHRR